MDNYERYEKINENIETFKLSNEAVTHFKDMYARLNLLKEKESIGELTEEDKKAKETLMADLDSFIVNFIQTRKAEIESHDLSKSW